MYQVLARKWRPQSFDELVGQQHVSRTLRNAIRGDRLAHAYIFAGVRGTGKTTVARLLAKCLNCEGGPTPDPCGRCTSCSEITEGRAIDVLEMDAASRTGVDDIRELQEVVSYAPVRDRYKILIIDEAHMLSRQAFNALLKTLEEPPPQVVFVLATTEMQKILPTILSRCQVFEFQRLPARETAAHLRRICETEKITISDDALERIARTGEGSVRDALSVLERVLAFCGTTVGDEDALQVLGAVRREILVRLVEALAARDAAGMLTVLDELAREGHDLVHFWSETIGVLRDLLMRRNVPDQADLLSRAREEMEALERAAAPLSQEDLVRAFQILAELEPGLKASSQPRFLFEATLIRLAGLGAVRPIEELLASLDAPGRTARPRGPEGGGGPSPRPPRRTGRSRAEPPAAEGPPGPRTKTEAVDGPPPATADPFPTFVETVRSVKPMVGALLETASASLEGDTWVVTLPEISPAVRKRLEGRDAQKLLRESAEKALGRPVGVRLAARGTESEPEKGPGRRSPSPASEPAGGEGKEPPPGDLLETAKREPGINKLLHDFGARVVDIRPLEAPHDLTAGEDDPGPMEDST